MYNAKTPDETLVAVAAWKAATDLMDGLDNIPANFVREMEHYADVQQQLLFEMAEQYNPARHVTHFPWGNITEAPEEPQ